MDYGLGKIERNRLSDVLRGTKGSISVSQASGILGVSSSNAAKMLSLWAKKGWVTRIKRGFYIPVPIESRTADIPLEDAWPIAERLFAPCYIGGWSAAEYWDLTEQIFKTVLVLTTQKPRDRKPVIKGTSFLLRNMSEKDLFALQRVGFRQIGTAIRHARHIEELQQAAADIRSMAHNMMAQGVAPEQLTQFISTFNDLLTARVVELECKASGLPGMQLNGEMCWMALGSEGRFEQTLNTDQDNAIIFSLPEGMDADQVRAQLLPVAKRINETLALCGFPLCKGEIMASNPKWCLSLEEWKRTFSGWISGGSPEALLHASIFFDFRALYGAHHLAEDLRLWLERVASDNSRFLHLMAENALRNRPPLGVVRDFVVGKENTLDLKLNGITPFVDAARIFSLAAGVSQTNTIQRLRLSAAKMNLHESEIEAWINALLFIQVLRLRHHYESSSQGLSDDVLDNLIDPERLNELDRRILKEAFRQARKLQARLAMEYHL